MSRHSHHRHTKNTHPSTPGQRLKYHRESQGLTQQELGDRLNVSKKTIQAYELDKREMTSSRILAITKELQTTPNHILIYGEDQLSVQEERKAAPESDIHTLAMQRFENSEFGKLLVAMIMSMDAIEAERKR